MAPLLLLIIPALASANIIISIQSSTSDSSINFRGFDSSIISDDERVTFGLTDEVLKTAAEKYSGGRPQDVFLHSPTPWGDLYKTYGWREIRRILKPVKATILDIQREDVVVSIKELDNNSSFSVKFDATDTSEVENLIKNKWHTAGVLSITEPISYKVNGAADFSYTSPWGIDNAEVKKLLIGAKSDVELSLEPGQIVTASLTAKEVTMTVQVDYTANLSGHVACNYPRKYKGHHFWRYEVNGLMGAGSLIRTVNCSDVINLKFYADPNIVVMNKKTKALISETPAMLSVV